MAEDLKIKLPEKTVALSEFIENQLSNNVSLNKKIDNIEKKITDVHARLVVVENKGLKKIADKCLTFYKNNWKVVTLFILFLTGRVLYYLISLDPHDMTNLLVYLVHNLKELL